MTQQKRSPGFVVAALCLVVAAAYAGPLFGGATFVGRDHLSHTLPSKQFLAEALRAGHLPQWWDAIDLGLPFAANPNHSALYPPAWIVALLPLPFGADLLLILHVVVAGLGMTRLARRWGASATGELVAGAVFALSGFVTSTLVHCGPLLTLAWTPWCAVAADRVALADSARDRYVSALLLALAFALHILAGDPSFVIIAGFVALAVATARAKQPLVTTMTVVASSLVGALLAAVVVVPGLYLFGEATRSDLDAVQAQTWSMHPWRLLEWFWAGALGDPNQPATHAARIIADASHGQVGLGPSWALSVYVGLPVVLLAAIGGSQLEGRRRIVLTWLIAFAILALGEFTPIYGVFRRLFPPEQLVRYPEKYAFGALVIVCALAGRGVTRLVDGALSRRLVIGVAVAVVAFGATAGIVLGVGASWLDGSRTNVEPDAWRAYAGHGALSTAITLAVVGLGFVLARRPRTRIVGLLVVVASLVGQLTARVWDTLPLLDRAVVSRPPAILAGIEKSPVDGVRTRIYRPRNLEEPPHLTVRQHHLFLFETAIQNTSTRFGYADVPGYDQGHFKRLERTWQAASRWWALAAFGIELAIVPAEVARAENMTPLGRDDVSGAVIARSESPRPRAFVTSRWRWFSREPDALAALFAHRAGPLDAQTLATVHLVGTGTDGTGTGPVRPCTEHVLRPERVIVDCDADEAGYAVVLDAWSPGWTATVDGSPARIELADGLARAVRVERGHHRIAYAYETPGLRLGALVSLLAWVGWAFAMVMVRRR